MRVVVACMMFSLLLLVGCDSGSSGSAGPDSGTTPAVVGQNAGSEASAGNGTTAGTGIVTFEIQGSDAPVTFEIADVQQGTTLEEVMRSVTQIPISIRGSGVTAFVDGIGEQSASGSQGWVFRVDGVHANQGVGSTVLTPPTTITWVYGDADDLVVE